MSALRKYLDENHPTPENVKDDFQKTFQVNVKQEGDLYLFKYGFITVKWSRPEMRECRGSILRPTEKGWEFVSRPFDKFFNQHEGHCPIFEPKAFSEALEDVVMYAKADGSCIQLWHDGKKWRSSTLGTITSGLVYDNKMSFSSLFESVVDSIFWDELDRNNTYLFELCTEENRIVTQYKNDHVVLLAARDRSSGGYLLYKELSYEVRKGAFRKANIRQPYVVYPHKMGMRTLDDVKEFIESESQNTEIHGKYPEGYVVYCNKTGHPIAKMKNAQYKSLHHVGGGDIAQTRGKVIDAIFLGFIDDIYDALTEKMKAFADKISKKAADLRAKTLETIANIEKKDFSSRKEFASYVIDNIDGKMQKFFFKNANTLMKKEEGVAAKFDLWIKENYKKLDLKDEKL